MDFNGRLNSKIIIRKEEKTMCPYFNPGRSECRVTPSDGNAYQDGNNKRDKCMSESGCKTCGNFESAARGDYKIVR